jgi:ABC-2 type transport system permease protein
VKRTSLLKKEVFSAKNRLLTLLILLVLLPAVFAGASVVFGDVIPRDSPIAVVPADEEVTDEELEAVEGVLSVFAETSAFRGDYETALERERFYVAIEVPHNFASGQAGTFVVHVHGAVVPFDEPSKIVANVLDGSFSAVGTDIDVERNVIGESKTLSEYLVPVLLLTLVLVMGLTYVPHELRREKNAIERLRLETSLVSVVAAKILFYTGVLAVPVAVFQAVSVYLGYGVTLLSLPTLVFLTVTFVYLALVGSAVTVATGFGPLGRFVNALLLFGVIVFSNIIYPVGFFSSLRREIAVLLPTHYSAVAVRSHATKEIPSTFFADWLGLLLGFTVLAFFVFVVTARRYEA